MARTTLALPCFAMDSGVIMGIANQIRKAVVLAAGEGKRLRPLTNALDVINRVRPVSFRYTEEYRQQHPTIRDQEYYNVVAQEFAEESDLAFIRDIEPYLRHRNYLRVDDRPVLIVYRAQALPNPVRTAERWKAYCRSVGLPEPYLIAAQTFGFEDARQVGFDAAVEFPPLNFKPRSVKSLQAFLNEGFQGDVFSYWDLVRAAIDREETPYRLLRTVTLLSATSFLATYQSSAMTGLPSLQTAFGCTWKLMVSGLFLTSFGIEAKFRSTQLALSSRAMPPKKMLLVTRLVA